jgi:hypothetical protein
MKTISAALFGAPLDPFSSQTRQHIALVAFLAWIGSAPTACPPLATVRKRRFSPSGSIPISLSTWLRPLR